MAIILDYDVKVVVQGVTGHQGQYHTKTMKQYGTNIVAGVTPGKGGEDVHGIPVYNTVERAVRETGANTSVFFVPAPFAKDAAYEAIDAGIKTIVLITEGVPFHDSASVMQYSKLKGTRIVGPNTPGMLLPGRMRLGIMPERIFKRGKIGVVSRSGTLTYEIVNSLSLAGFGQSTCIGLGGDPIVGTRFQEVLELFEKDDETDGVVMIGEIGGTEEEDACNFIKKMEKDVYAYIAGRTAPPEKRMGHAGAIVTRGKGTAKSKIDALTRAGVKVAEMPWEIAKLMSGND
jgi:succinyl-CoA synthetase alpha subunit